MKLCLRPDFLLGFHMDYILVVFRGRGSEKPRLPILDSRSGSAGSLVSRYHSSRRSFFETELSEFLKSESRSSLQTEGLRQFQPSLRAANECCGRLRKARGRKRQKTKGRRKRIKGARRTEGREAGINNLVKGGGARVQEAANTSPQTWKRRTGSKSTFHWHHVGADSA